METKQAAGLAKEGAAGVTARRVVICGAGVIGSSIAYQLSLRRDDIPEWDITVVERCEVACAASGKAGGFLALDWCDRGPVGPLARKSFEMFPKIAEQLEGIDYRRVDTLGVAASQTSTKRVKNLDDAPQWLDGSSIRSISVMGDTETTAQVHPAKYTKAMMEAAQARGIKLRIGCVQGIEFRKEKDSTEPTVIGVTVDSEVIPADAVVIAMGPWSGKAHDWLRSVPLISGHKAHSIVLHPPSPVTAHALFVDFHGTKQSSPEIYPRPDGQVYVCGESDDTPLPSDPARVEPTTGACENLVSFAKSMSSVLAGSSLEKQQACYLPISPDGTPVIGRLPLAKGAYIATGHSCWGILNSPATGLAMAELLIDGKATSVDISGCDPQRFVSERRNRRD